MSKWTIKEKKILLDALQNVGYKDMAILQARLPSRTAEEIEAICSKYENLAKTRLEKRKKDNPSIDTWIEIFQNISNARPNQLDDITARVIKYLSIFETNDSEPMDPKIKKCYHWLAQALQGREPDPADGFTSSLLEQCLSQLMKATRVPNKSAERYIRSVEVVPLPGMWVENPSTNPLQIPDKFLEIEESEKKDPFDMECARTYYII
ncbi:unnamed protein product [Acanthoscelides obtectus]|uniref:Myb-like domain-containing protein n=1 Tax=Acanthoscelides obtectus TaxID=200917 RepID=A0A9P0LAQ2_ACAOB|nr:unnamed protein product [Acanthoscelides obtectus]CAK1639369.1 hypothetical protein AOBTE_LOCUS11146 [Acanthoscelides obtectus]